MAKLETRQDVEGIPRAGELLASKYRIGETLGRGGMGVVVAGRHEALEQSVAIKFLRPDYAKDGESLRRFLREARAAARIHNAHATRIFDIDATDAGVPYIVMERLEGENLERALADRGPFPVPLAVDCILQTCEALAHAHAAGLVHRDLKPSNLFLVREPGGAPMLKVLDFGVSKTLDDATHAESRLTAPNTTLGSPQYMAPEQVRDARAVDARTDIWALGVILFELLTGETPFVADSIPHLYALILSTPATPLRALLPKAPAKLEEAIARCLEKDPARRPQDVAQLARALQPFASAGAAEVVARIARACEHAPSRSPSTPPSSTPRPRTGSGDIAFDPTLAASAPRGAWRGGLAAAAGVALVGGAVALLVPRGAAESPSSGAASSSSAVASPIGSPIAAGASVGASPPSAAPIAIEASAEAVDASRAIDAGAPAARPAPGAPPSGSRVRDLRGIKLLP